MEEEEEEEDEEDCEFRLLSDVGSQSEDVSHSLLNGILWISIRIYPKPTEIEALNVHIFINVFLHINSKKVKGVFGFFLSLCCFVNCWLPLWFCFHRLPQQQAGRVLSCCPVSFQEDGDEDKEDNGEEEEDKEVEEEEMQALFPSNRVVPRRKKKKM